MGDMSSGGDCPRCREVLKMLFAHKEELERARAHLDDAYECVNDEAMYVHTMAKVLRGALADEVPPPLYKISSDGTIERVEPPTWERERAALHARAERAERLLGTFYQRVMDSTDYRDEMLVLLKEYGPAGE